MKNLFDQIVPPDVRTSESSRLLDLIEPIGPRRVRVRDFARNVLESREYRASLVDRIVDRQLPPQVESLLYHYAYGKPVERVEVNAPNASALESMSIEEIEDRISKLLSIAQTLRRQMAEEDEDQRSIH